MRVISKVGLKVPSFGNPQAPIISPRARVRTGRAGGEPLARLEQFVGRLAAELASRSSRMSKRPDHEASIESAVWPPRQPPAARLDGAASRPHVAFCNATPQAHGRAEQTSSLLSGVTVVVPVYNSEQTLGDLIAALARILPSCGVHYELILVNDGSRDGSWSVIRELAAQH